MSWTVISIDMSSRELEKKSDVQDLQWVACMGEFALLRNLISRKRHSFLWMLFGWLDALLRGFGQVVFANNPISGFMIIIAFALTVPGTLVAGAGTGFLGLLLSLVSVSRIRGDGTAEKLCVAPHCGPFLPHNIANGKSHGLILLRDVGDNIENGLTVYNPLLIGSVTYALVPKSYGHVDAFAILIILVGTIFSVYLTRSLATGRFPCVTVPFNVVEIILLLVLTMQRDFGETSTGIVAEQYGGSGKNTTEIVPIGKDGPTNETTFSTENLNWGLVFRGVVTSASQVYAVDNVAVGSVIYLGIIVYSPITALFSFLGALTGSLVGKLMAFRMLACITSVLLPSLIALGLKVPYVSVYAGLWGYNGLLTGAAFGGLFLVISGQTGAVAFIAIIFTTLFQYVAEPLMARIGLPVLTIPFVVTAWLFFGLRDSVDGTFPRPALVTFPEHEFHNFRSRLGDPDATDDSSDPEIPSPGEKKSSND